MAETVWYFGVNVPRKPGDNASTGSAVASTTLKLTAPAGVYDGDDTVTLTDADFIAGNIKKDVDLFGVVGTLEAGAGANQANKTGQTTSYVTGDDGDLEAGYVVSPRWTDNTNNTITDNGTSLMWIKEPAKIVPSGTAIVGDAHGEWLDATAYHANDMVSTNLYTVNNELFAVGTSYSLGNYVKSTYDGYRYVCKSPYMADDYEPAVSPNWTDKWSDQNVPDWASGETYTANQLVLSPGGYSVFKCLIGYTAVSNAPGTTGGDTKWQRITDWNYPVAYSIGDLVIGTAGEVFRCKSAHTSTIDDIPSSGTNYATYWDSVCSFNYGNYWSAEQSYTINSSTVTDNGTGYYYLCTSSHVSGEHYPGMDYGYSYWEYQMSVSQWNSGGMSINTYSVDDLVTHSDGSSYEVYKCTSAHTATAYVPGVMGPDTYWATAFPSNYWNSSTAYVKGQFVSGYYHDAVCLLDHTSSTDDHPDTGVNRATYWSYVPRAYVCISAHTSSTATLPFYGATSSTKWIPTVWNTGSSLTTADYWNWPDTIKNCNDLVYAGHNDWRMPNMSELYSLVLHSAYNPCINATIFPNTICDGYSDYPPFYWTSTTDAASTDYAKTVDFWNFGAARTSPSEGSGSLPGVKPGQNKLSPYGPQYCRPVRSI